MNENLITHLKYIKWGKWILTGVILPEGCTSAHDVDGRRRVVPLGLVGGTRGVTLEGGRRGGGFRTRWFALVTILALGPRSLLRSWVQVLCNGKNLWWHSTCNLSDWLMNNPSGKITMNWLNFKYVYVI